MSFHTFCLRAMLSASERIEFINWLVNNRHNPHSLRDQAKWWQLFADFVREGK